jgi:DNA polymerase elongation subunit (family B)
MSKPRIALFDVETCPTLGWVWALHETDVIAVEEPWYMLSFAYKWLGEKKVHCHALPDYPGYKKAMRNDELMLRDLWKMLDEADVVIGHNVDKFDVRKTNARFLVNKFNVPRPYKTIDTLKISRKHFHLDSHRLDALARVLGIGAKLPHIGFKMWQDCMNGVPAAWRNMEKYNIHDVNLLEEVYERLRPWATTHPDLTIYDGRPGCPTCQSANIIRKGVGVSKTRKYEQLKCNDCGHWFQGANIKRGIVNAI